MYQQHDFTLPKHAINQQGIEKEEQGQVRVHENVVAIVMSGKFIGDVCLWVITSAPNNVHPNLD
jgi:hypothetical protein